MTQGARCFLKADVGEGLEASILPLESIPRSGAIGRKYDQRFGRSLQQASEGEGFVIGMSDKDQRTFGQLDRHRVTLTFASLYFVVRIPVTGLRNPVTQWAE